MRSKNPVLSYASIATLAAVLAVPRGMYGANEGKQLARVDYGESGAQREAGAALPSNSPRSFNLPAVAQPTLYTGDFGFIVNVPAGSAKLEVMLTTGSSGADVDMYIRREADPGLVNGQIVADFASLGPGGDETITVQTTGWTSTSEGPRTSPTLQPGNYHIAFAVLTVNRAISGTIVANISGPTTPPSVNLTGTWNWSASCATGPSSGQFQLQQTGSAITGSFAGADQGTISGTVQGNQFTFTRTWSAGTQLWSGTATSSIGGQVSLQGTVTGTNPATQCTFSATAGTSGGGTTGNLTVVIAQEDNSECPARKKLSASVTDSNGQAVTGLGASNFTLTEGGQPVQIVSVVCTTSGASTAAGSVAIVIDRSGSLSAADLTAEKTAAKQLVDQLPASDAIAVYSFGSTVTVHQAFTTDKNVAKAAIDAISGGGNTLLYQAIIDASNALASRPGRKAIVVMTDGQNTGTSPSEQDAINAAKTAQAPVFTVGFGSGINQPVLQQIASDTGGVFLSGANSASLTQLLGRIGTVLTSQCVITYVPINPAASSTVVLTARVTSAGSTQTGSVTRTVSACAAPGGGGGSTGTCSTNLLVNGGFETPGNGGSTYRTLGAGDSSLNGWTVGDAGVDYIGGLWQASTGTHSIDLNAGAAGRLSQAFATAAGRQYLVTFDMAGNPSAPNIKRMRVSAAGQSQDFEFDISGKTATNMGWQRKTWTFTANSASTVLEFRSLIDTAYGPALDNVWVCEGSGGGGAATGGLTVVITQEDNSECPARKKLSASVTDSTGQAVTGLGTSNFTLTEGGQPVQIVSVVCTTTGGSTAAGSVAIVIDRSGSLSAADLTAEKTAAKQLVDQLPASDAIAVYSFGSTVTVHQAFTTDKNVAKAAIDAISGGGNTLLYQAIIDASNALASRPGRKAIVVMTDGQNTGTSPSDQDAINAAKTAQAPVFTVGFGSGINQPVLQQIASDTGGVFLSGANSASLTQLLGRIGTVLTSQCVITYVPINPASPASVVLTANAPAGGTARSGSTTRTVSACAAQGGGGGSTTQPGCDYFVRPLEYSFGQSGGTAGGSAPPGTTFNPPVLITTRAECRWGSISNDAWISIEAGQSGQGDGAVSYRVATNSTNSARTGTVTIAGRTHTVRQAAGSACSYSISPTSATVAGMGGFGTIDVSASAADCAWTAAAQAGWINLNGGQRTAAGTGNGSVRFAAGGNPGTTARTGTISIAGRTFTVTQNPAGTSGQPSIPDNGVVPSGSGTPPSLPGGAIAQGSFFTVFAYDVGPANPEQATAYPLPTVLGGTEVLLRQGSTAVNAYIAFTSRSQVNGIVPSNAPLGDVDMIVSYNGVRGNPVRIRVVRNNFNIFTTRAGSGPGIITNFVTATNQPLNTRTTPAMPGQVITIWGNGGGPIAAPDSLAPPAGNLPFDFEVIVGGKPQPRLLYYGRTPCCSALDQVVVELSADVPLGCAVPVQVRAGGSGAPWSNVATMAISRDGGACTDAGNPVSTLPQTGGKVGGVLLIQGNALIPLQANAAPENVRADLGIGMFLDVPAGGALGFSSFASFPPVGSCQALAGNQDVSSLLGGSLPGLSQGLGGTQLDAGTQLTVTGPSGRTVPLPRTDTSATTGPYAGLLGGSIPFPGLTPVPDFLDAGSYRVSGPGGTDVGSFNATVTFPRLVTWTNRSQTTSMNRAQGVLVEWSGGGADDRVLVIGAASDQRTKAGSGFVCVAAGSDRRFQVPASVMSNLPVTRGAALGDSFGLLGISSLSLGSIASFTARGLDSGFIVPGTLDLRTVEVQ